MCTVLHARTLTYNHSESILEHTANLESIFDLETLLTDSYAITCVKSSKAILLGARTAPAWVN
jgi:hypothetical protein